MVDDREVCSEIKLPRYGWVLLPGARAIWRTHTTVQEQSPHAHTAFSVGKGERRKAGKEGASLDPQD